MRTSSLNAVKGKQVATLSGPGWGKFLSFLVCIHRYYDNYYYNSRMN